MTSKLTQLLETARSLPEFQQRKIASLLGAAVADAAARPLHWVYDLSALNKYIKDVRATPEFFPENRSPFYAMPTGENSCYFDQAGAVLAALKHGYNYDEICKELVARFGPDSKRYNMAKREEYMQLRREGRIDGPIEGKWMHGCLIKFLENRHGPKPFGDAHIKETDGFCCAVPVVAKFAGEDGLTEKVKEMVTTMSTWPTAVSHGMVAARILEKFVVGKEADPIRTTKAEIQNEFPDVFDSLEAVEAHLSDDHVKAVGFVFGRPCYNPGSFQGALHALMTSESFAEAVRMTIRAGGCNCSRALFIGACAGAKYGLDGIPKEWIEKTHDAEEVLKDAIDVVKG